MDESDFWLALEHRLCLEFAEMPENEFRYLWCDGFIPELYLADHPSPSISGKVWVCDDRRQEEWKFKLILHHPVPSLSEIDWPSLLPPEDVTQWLTVYFCKKFIEIEPSIAVPIDAE